MTGDEIRELFLNFFRDREHLLVPSASLIPAKDPTLLLTSAGMVQFKPYFTGELEPPRPRLTSCQKCFRATDIGEVGDRKHLTFFEMLGNFSVGDYFKGQAISWAWEFVTQHLLLPPERLWATVFLDDDDAWDHWHKDVGLPASRIVRLGEHQNFWGPPGTEGPCGPCSELHYDLGPDLGCNKVSCGTPECDCERFVELWNLVFMQFYQHVDGRREKLPAPNIDTGLGLERATAILQGVTSAYETDLLWPIVQRVEELSGQTYGKHRDVDYAIRVVVEHVRSATFLIADGVVPTGAEERGSVLRKITRRALYYGRTKLKMKKPFMGRVGETVIERMGGQYPELRDHRTFVLKCLDIEEERFGNAVRKGSDFLHGYIRGVGTLSKIELYKIKDVLAPATNGGEVRDPRKVAKTTKALLKPLLARLELARNDVPSDVNANAEGYMRGVIGITEAIELLREASTSNGGLLKDIERSTVDCERVRQCLLRLEGLITVLPASLLFYMYDTHGFPVELIEEVAKDQQLEMDIEGFEEQMEEQRNRGRMAAQPSEHSDVTRIYETIGVKGTTFLGYEILEATSTVLAIVVNGQTVEKACDGEEAQIVLESTPFFAEGGGQVGDTGTISGPSGGHVIVNDVQRPSRDIIVHIGVVNNGDISIGQTVQASVQPERRADIARNHTATHLLQAALRQVLGTHTRQAGSLVATDRLRFDFTHLSPMSKDELFRVQCLVNQKIREDVPVKKRETSYREAIAIGALAFFGERYDDQVQVVEVEGAELQSLEVCGGTHVGSTGQIGYLHIVSEAGIGSGLRRIEAVTGRSAELLLWERGDVLDTLARKLQGTVSELEQRLDAMIRDVDVARKQISNQHRAKSREEADQILARVQQVGGIQLVSTRTDATSLEGMRWMCDRLRNNMNSGVIVLGGVLEGRPMIVATVTKDLIEKGIHAGNLAKAVAQCMGGGGGGRADMAQAGGKNAEQLDDALARVPQFIGLQGGSS